jgi:hypothetical protein
VGLGALTRYSFAWLIFPVALFILLFTDARRVVLCLAAVGAFAVLLTPWMVRNWNVSGAVFGTATYDALKGTLLYPGDQLERSLNPHVVVLPRFVWMKMLANARTVLQGDFLHAGGGWITALFLAGLLVPFRNPTIRRVRYFLVSSLAVLFFAQTLGRTHLSDDSPAINSENLLVVFAPLVVVYAVSFFFLLLDPVAVKLPTQGARSLVFTAFASLACLPLILTLCAPPPLPIVYPPYYPTQIQQVGDWMAEREAVMSDEPWAVAWYGNRPAVWLSQNATPFPLDPDSPENFVGLNRRYPVSALYLTSKTLDGRFISDIAAGGEASWGNFAFEVMTRHEKPEQFPLTQAFEGFGSSAIFLSDRKRW